MKRALPYILSAAVLFPLAASAQPQPPEPPGPPGPMMMGHGGGGMMGMGRQLHAGIPPQLAARLGIPAELQKKIQQQAFTANEQLINLDAELKRSKLELQKLLAADRPNQSAVMAQLDKVTRAEGEVRKNRIGLMLQIRETLGPDLWKKVEAEFPRGPGMRGKGPRGGKGRPGRQGPGPQ